MVLVVGLLLAGPAASDEVRLKNGNKLVGIARTEDDRVIVEVGGGTVTLWRWDVAEIVPGKTPLHELHERSEKIRGSTKAEDYYTLALWAKTNGISHHGISLLERALALDPNHAGAREMLDEIRKAEEHDAKALPFESGSSPTRVPAAKSPGRMVEVPVLYMGASPYRDVHSRNRNYSRYRSSGGRWYGGSFFGSGRGHVHHGAGRGHS
jgi:hypothetical protein